MTAFSDVVMKRKVLGPGAAHHLFAAPEVSELALERELE
jgi:hypothetical protein